MSERYSALTVVLEQDLNEEDAEALMSAIRQIRGVLAVHGCVSDIATYIAEIRIKTDLWNRLRTILSETDTK